MLRWFFCCFFLLISSAVSGVATAEGFQWEQTAAVQTSYFGPVDYGVLTVEVFTQEGPSDFEYETLIQTTWKTPQTSTSNLQVLFEGFGSAHASEFNIELEGQTLVLRYPVDDRYDAEPQRIEERWQWHSGEHRFTTRTRSVPEHTEQAVGRVVTLLQSNRLGEAREALNHLIRSAQGGLLVQSDTIFYHFLEATHRLAAVRFREGAVDEAAALVLRLFISPPFIAPSLHPTTNGFVICASPTLPCESGFNELPVTGQTASLLQDCAFFLARAGHDQLATNILSQVVRFFPSRGGVHLDLADALWDLGRATESRAHYLEYLTLTAVGDSHMIPARAFVRVGERAQAAPDH